MKRPEHERAPVSGRRRGTGVADVVPRRRVESIRQPRIRLAVWLGAVALVGRLFADACPAIAAETPASPASKSTSARTARASVTRVPLDIDGHLDELAWRHAKRHAGFIERKPRLRARPPEVTWFSVLYDGSFLYIGVFCGERDAAQIRARTTARDSFAIFSDDAISVKLDAGHDHRTTAGFVLNPAGARLDYRGINESQMRREFDARWSGAAARVPGGWSAEFRIPWASLGIDPADPPETIGLNLTRDHAGRNATYDWALMPPPFSAISASLYGHLSGFSALAGLPREASATSSAPVDSAYRIVPWLLAGAASTPRRVATFDGGVDASLRLGSGVRAQVTVNTDFAQANVDDQVVNLSRFSLFMPEKREFFLRDVEVFTFGRSSSAQLFHSRRIGLNAGQRIPIFLGLKAVGQPAPSLRFGLLDVVTRPPSDGEQPWSNHSVARGQWQATDGSNIGIMWTHRQSLSLAGDHNSVVGLDGAFRGGGSPLLIEGFTVLGRSGTAAKVPTADVGAVTSGTAAAQRVHAGTAIDATWRGAVVRPSVAYSWFDGDFRADLGFYRRVGVHSAETSLVVEPRIGAYGLERVNVKGWVNGVADRAHLLDRGAGAQALVVWNAGYTIEVLADQTQLTVQNAFTVGRDTTIGPGRYDHTRIGMTVGTPWVRAAAVNTSLILRDYFDGHMLENTGSLVFRPGGFLRLEAGWSLSRVSFTDERAGFLAAVINGRAAVGFTPDLNLDLFVGWNRLERRVPVNARLRWTWRRGSDVFVVWQGTFQGEQPQQHSLLAKWTWSLP